LVDKWIRKLYTIGEHKQIVH